MAANDSAAACNSPNVTPRWYMYHAPAAKLATRMIDKYPLNLLVRNPIVLTEPPLNQPNSPRRQAQQPEIGACSRSRDSAYVAKHLRRAVPQQHPASAPMQAHGFKMNPQAAVIPIPMH